MIKKVLVGVGIMFAAVALVKAMSREKRPLRTVASIDLSRYAGQWYEIARLPNRFQKNCDGDVKANYTILDRQKIKVVNQCRSRNGELKSVEGRARLASRKGPNSKLEVRFAPAFLSFLPFVWGDYWVLYLSPAYSHAVIGEPGRKYLWILSRTPQLDEEAYQELVKRATEQGYDTSRLIRTKQSAASR